MSKPSNHGRTGCVFIIVCLLIALALFGMIKSSEEQGSANASAGNTSEIDLGNSTTAAEGDAGEITGPEDAEATGQLINACYHLDSCSYAKIESRNVIDQSGDETLVKAMLINSAIFSADPDAPFDPSTLRWTSKTAAYAICSTSRPTIILDLEGRWLAEQFDLTSISGVKQNNATIYQALCHDAFANEVANDPGHYSYHSIDASMDQFEVSSPEALFSGQ